MLGMAQKGDCKLIQFISVEATKNVFKDEPVLTVYLRDMTNYVKAIKHELKSDKNRMKNEYAKKIEDTLVDLARGKDAPTDVAGMKALIEKEAAKPTYGLAAANRHDNIDDTSMAFDKVMKL